MRIAFKTKTLPHISIKTNGNIKKSIDAYRKSQVPLSRLLTSFLAIKTIPEKLSEVDNPWAYYVKGIEKHKVESGVTRDESLFLFAAMNLKDELPTDVINAALHHFRNLIYVVVFHSSVYNLCENVLRDTSFVIDALGEEQEKESRVRIKKSLNTEQETSLFSELLLDPNEEGSYIALLLMWGLGLRNAEACGLNYGDLKSIEGHPDCYAAWIYKTTKIDSNELQAGGKTYNTGRIVPVPDKIVSFLSIRERQIQALISEQGINANIEELPICCAGYIERESDAYLTRCKSGDVTKASHIVFDRAGISPEQVAYLDIELSEGNTASILKEKDPTAYLLRRNYATHMSILGLTNAEMQYLMGHNVEDAYESRNEFVDSERIYEMYRKLRNRPLLNHSISNDNTDRICIPKQSTMRIHASALEPTDAVTVRIETNSPEMVQSNCFESAHPGEYSRTINIQEQYRSGYQSSAGMR